MAVSTWLNTPDPVPYAASRVRLGQRDGRNRGTEKEAHAGRMVREGKEPDIYLCGPAIDYVALMRSQGVDGERLTAPQESRQQPSRLVGAIRPPLNVGCSAIIASYILCDNLLKLQKGLIKVKVIATL
jgi:hypothetical protein